MRLITQKIKKRKCVTNKSNYFRGDDAVMYYALVIIWIIPIEYTGHFFTWWSQCSFISEQLFSMLKCFCDIYGDASVLICTWIYYCVHSKFICRRRRRFLLLNLAVSLSLWFDKWLHLCCSICVDFIVDLVASFSISRSFGNSTIHVEIKTLVMATLISIFWQLLSFLLAAHPSDL